MNRWRSDDDDPAPIGADPDRPRSTTTGGSRQTDASRVLDAFERAWHDARRDDDDQLPLRPCPTQNSRKAFFGWVNSTFIPKHCSGDVELAIAVVELFCEQVAAGAPGWAYRPNTERGAWDLWKHLSPRAESTRQLLLDRGWVSTEERRLRERQEADRRAEAAAELDRHRSREAERQRREQERASAPSLIRFRLDGTPERAAYDWLLNAQTADYSDWVEVPDH